MLLYLIGGNDGKSQGGCEHREPRLASLNYSSRKTNHLSKLLFQCRLKREQHERCALNDQLAARQSRAYFGR